jgi:excisionase family DNA binding protein
MVIAELIVPIRRRRGYLTPAQVAAHLQVSSATIMRLLRSGRLADCKIGRQWRIPSEDLARYLNDNGDHGAPDDESVAVR